MITLHTRDGTKNGNAIIIGPIRTATGKEMAFLIETDFGNRSVLSSAEIEERFTLGHLQSFYQWSADRSRKIERLGDEADLCRNDGANDIADLLDEDRAVLASDPLADAETVDAIRKILAQTKGPGDFKNLLLHAPKEKTASSRALIAAAQGSEAVAELLRYHREGPQAYSAFGDIDVVELLAEAVLIAGRIAIDHLPETEHNREYRDEIGQLTAAAARFIDGRAG